MARPPKIVVPGLNRGQGVPAGYILGRSSSGRGPVELLRPQDIRAMRIGGGAGVTVPPAPTGFGFYAEGLMLSGEVLGSAIYNRAIQFADGNGVANALVAPMADAVFEFRVATTSLLVGQLEFAAGSTAGAVTWFGGFTLPASTPLRVTMPIPADLSLADVSATVYGTPVV